MLEVRERAGDGDVGERHIRFAAARQLLTRGWQLQEAWAAAGRPMGGKK